MLKMVRLIKDGSSKGRDSAMRPQKEFVIHPNDVVQIIAKDVPLRRETLKNGRVRESRAEMVTDSVLSQGRHGDLERELKPWTPDSDDFKDLGLESTFENTWNRNWDQFEINRTLFGVESTFDEEIYTTKLEKGPQMRDREIEACRIAREIEGQSAKNLHLAEERGLPMRKDFELLDEESRYSSVLRSTEDVGEENEDVNTDSHNGETFVNLQNHTAAAMTTVDGELSLKKAESNKTGRSFSADLNKDPIITSVDILVTVADSLGNTLKKKSPHCGVGDRSNKHSIRVGGFPSPRPSTSIGDTTGFQALNLDPGSPHVTEDVYRDFNEFRQQENAKRGRKLREEQVNELKSFSKTLQDLTVIRQHTAVTSGSTSKTAGACAPPASALPLPTSITNPISTLAGSDTGLGHGSLSHLTPSSSKAESTKVVANKGDSASGLPQSEQAIISSSNLDTPVSPPNSTTSTTVPSSPLSASDVSSSASFPKKSSLNPHAKEFKLNPNARSFTPNFTPLRPPSPVGQGSLYVPGMLPPGSPMQGVPMGDPRIPQAGQPGTKYTPYNNVGALGGVPFLPSPGTFTSTASGAPMPPPLVGGGQATVKMPPQLQQPATGHSYGLQQAVRYPSQTPSAYMHPSTHMYSQQMVFGHPGQVLYYQPYPPQGIPMPPPPPAPQPTSTASQLQTHHRAGIQEMQMCVPPPYIAGHQHFFSPQLSNPMQPAAAALPSNTMPTIHSSQGLAGGMPPQTVASPGGTISNPPVLKFGGVGASA